MFEGIFRRFVGHFMVEAGQDWDARPPWQRAAETGPP